MDGSVLGGAVGAAVWGGLVARLAVRADGGGERTGAGPEPAAETGTAAEPGPVPEAVTPPPRRLLPGLLTAAVCTLLALALPPSGGHPETVVWLLLAPVAVALALIDAASFRLPDVLTLPAAAGTAAGLGLVSLVEGASEPLLRALLGGVVLAAGYGVVALAAPSGMGLGDVKLALTVGQATAWYGWSALLTATLAGLLLSAAAALVLLALRRADRKTALPFGPAMLAGAVAAMVGAA